MPREPDRATSLLHFPDPSRTAAPASRCRRYRSAQAHLPAPAAGLPHPAGDRWPEMRTSSSIVLRPPLQKTPGCRENRHGWRRARHRAGLRTGASVTAQLSARPLSMPRQRPGQIHARPDRPHRPSSVHRLPDTADSRRFTFSSSRRSHPSSALSSALCRSGCPMEWNTSQ